ncbi:MAG: DEAD/DEAH box helicase, partial [Quadrisphaera sp.]
AAVRAGSEPPTTGGGQRRRCWSARCRWWGTGEREAARFAPDLRVHTHHGPDRLRGEALLQAAARTDLVLTTYPLVARDADDLAAVAWRRVALDEAQHVKNLGTRAARAVRQVAGPPFPAGAGGSPGRTQKIALTGTPVENRLAELHAVVDFTNPGVLGSATRFRERFSVPVERHGDERATQLLTTLTRPLVLRRTKTDPGVAPDLPAKLELVVRANLTTEQAALYKAVVDEMLAKIKEAEQQKNKEQRRGLVLATLTRLKQVCNHPAQLLADGSPFLRRGQHRSGKLALVDDVLDTVVADGEKALLFTQYRELGALLVPHLEQRYGVEVPYLHGGVSKKARDAMVQRFSGRPEDRDDDGASPIMLLSLRAGGTGLNLVAANHVVHVDRWWNPAVEAQATDRAFRIGQTRQVQVRKLVCVGTVEERVDELMTRKADLASAVVRSTDAADGRCGLADRAVDVGPARPRAPGRRGGGGSSGRGGGQDPVGLVLAAGHAHQGRRHQAALQARCLRDHVVGEALHRRRGGGRRAGPALTREDLRARRAGGAPRRRHAGHPDGGPRERHGAGEPLQALRRGADPGHLGRRDAR